MTSRVGRVLVALVAASVVMGGCDLGGRDGCPRLEDVKTGICIVEPDERPVAPTVAFPVLGDQASELSVRDYAGDVVVVNFWGSWCPPCRAEQPDLNTVAQEYRDRGVSFLGVDVQEVSETNGLLHEEELAIPYPSLWDPATEYAARFDAIGPQVMPATVVVDRHGRVAVSIFGPTDEAELSRLLDEVLAEVT